MLGEKTLFKKSFSRHQTIISGLQDLESFQDIEGQLIWLVCAVYYAVQGGFVDEILKCDPIQTKAIEKYFPVVVFIVLDMVVLINF